MPVNQALIYLVTAANAYSNIFLYRFLVNLTANNTAINETDKEVLKKNLLHVLKSLFRKRIGRGT